MLQLVRRWLLTLGCVAFAVWQTPQLPQRAAAVAHAPDIDAAVQASCAVLMTVVIGWLAVICLAGIVDVRIAKRLGPAWLVALVIGVGLSVPAQASSSVLDGLTLPDRPTTTSRAVSVTRPASGPAEPAGPQTRVTIHEADTLWAIVAAQLPRGSSNATIAAAVDEWARANRAVIGPDPDQIKPGQIIQAPKESRS